jgi:hypothetical protein
MNDTFKTLLTTVAPTLATMLGGPLAGAAVTALEGCFGLPAGAGADGITKVVQAGGMTPDVMASIRAADQKHAEIVAQQGIDLEKLNKDHEQAMAGLEVDDRKDARKNNSSATMPGGSPLRSWPPSPRSWARCSMAAGSCSPAASRSRT